MSASTKLWCNLISSVKTFIRDFRVAKSYTPYSSLTVFAYVTAVEDKGKYKLW